MESNFSLTPSEAHPETMDFLSRAWCNFAVQTLQPTDHDQLQDQSLVLDNPVKKLDLCDNNVPFTKMEKSNMKMDDSDFKSFPPWKSNDVKSWIWMQQAMHPELNYNSCFRKKWKLQLPWKIPFKGVSVKKWLKEFKQKRKEEDRLGRAEVHAAISVAGIAAALAAIAAENTKRDGGADEYSRATKEAAVASAAALVAAQCAKVAEAMGAKKEQLCSAIGSAMSSTSASDILTLTAAATTSLRGAATLKTRTGCKINKLNGCAPVLPIEDNNDFDFNFGKCRSMLAKGTDLSVETPDGKYKVRSVSIVLDSHAKVILKLRKLKLMKSKKESIIIDLHAECYKDPETDYQEVDDDDDTCYLLVLTTNNGTIKLDMADDYQLYKTWATTINHMLTLSTAFTKYEVHQFYKN